MDFDSFGKAGVSLGSGALLICDEDTCVVDLAKVLVNFFRIESCGKCTPCRIGTQRAYQVLDGISEGVGKMNDLKDLEALADAVRAFELRPGPDGRPSHPRYPEVLPGRGGSAHQSESLPGRCLRDERACRVR